MAKKDHPSQPYLITIQDNPDYPREVPEDEKIGTPKVIETSGIALYAKQMNLDGDTIGCHVLHKSISLPEFAALLAVQDDAEMIVELVRHHARMRELLDKQVNSKIDELFKAFCEMKGSSTTKH